MAKIPRCKLLWDNFTKVHTPDPITPYEGEKVIKRLWKMVTGESCHVQVGHGRCATSLIRNVYGQHADEAMITYAPSRGWYEILEGLAFWVQRPRDAQRWSNEMVLHKMISAGIKRGYFAGVLQQQPKAPKPKPTKDDVRVLKVKRLEARIEAWEKKQKRASTALKKLRRSLNATRRHL